MNLNKAELIGNLTADPTARTLPSGTEIACFSLATSYKWRDGSKEPKTEVEYHVIVAYGRLGKVILSYLKKGDRIYIDGRLRTVQMPGKTPSYRTQIIASNLIMLGSSKAAKQEKVNDEVVVEEINPEKV